MSIKIDQAFTDTLLNAGLAIDIVHENGAYSVWGGASYSTTTGVYEPTVGREFIEERTIPANRSTFTLADSDEEVGVYQATIRYPVDQGAIAAKTKAEALITALPIGNKITYSGQEVHLISSRRDGGRVADFVGTTGSTTWYQIVVTINYTAYLARQ